MVCGCGATGAALSCTGVDAEPQPPATISAVAHTQANNTRVSVIRAFHPPCARTWRCAGSCARAGPDPTHREAVPGSRAAHQESCRQASFASPVGRSNWPVSEPALEFIGYCLGQGSTLPLRLLLPDLGSLERGFGGFGFLVGGVLGCLRPLGLMELDVVRARGDELLAGLTPSEGHLSVPGLR